MMTEESVILARSVEGAQAAARLVVGNALTIVDESLSPESRQRLQSARPREVLVECDTDNPRWLGNALLLARSSTEPGRRLRLVIPPGLADPPTEQAIAEVFSGWAVTGVTVEGEVTSLSVTPTSEDIDPAVTRESVQGALMVASLLNTVADPASGDLPDFEYRSSLAMSYLREIPRLHAETEALQAELRDLRASEHRMRQKLESIGSEVARSEEPQPARIPATTPPTATGRKTRSRKLVLLLAGALLWAAFSWLVTIGLDADIGGFLTLLVLGAVLAAAFDARRRAITLHNVADRGARAGKATQQMQQSAEQSRRQTMASLRTLAGSVMSQAESVRNQTAQVGTQLAGAVANSTREVVGKLETSAEAVIDSIRKTAEAVEASSRSISEQSKGQSEQILDAIPKTHDLRTLVRAELLTTYQQVEANLHLRDLVTVTGPTPQLRGWAASPDVIVLLIRELRRTRPGLIVECGSGASTVWMAMACQSAQIESRIVALEHDPIYAAETARLLSDCGVDDIAEVRLAPLENVAIDEFDGPWYSQAALEGLDGIGLLFVDGPPGTTGPLARYPALPLMRSRLADGATIVLDDHTREEEQETASRWVAELPEAAVTTHSFEKGAAVFRLDGNRDPGGE